MSIHDIVLFVSSTSKLCVPPVHFIRQSNINMGVRLVRLDTLADRQNAMKGQYFQIHSVPTLLVTYTDGNLQQFIGQEKVMQWLKQLLSKMNTPPQPQENVNVQHVPPKPKRRKPRKPRRRKRRISNDQNVPKHTSKRRNKPVKFEEPEDDYNSSGESEEETEIEFLDEPPPSQQIQPSGGNKYPQRPPPPPTGGLMVGSRANNKKKVQSTNLMALVKQMKNDRKNTLGYREEDLPPTS